ncbi:FAD-binding protein [Rhodococcus rhodochrous]|uniref:FAD-binding oxidoreductase n=1 Tax=Rhodococcus rhodochrous TaxID=1829 RepID=UPI001E2B507A|nr:FAD-linked oxidase C-terminal domain-containing protein [Rhodococcus rhodochrous]MCB8913395.1 FAD-binding protein [Rhodococcus rhodochrous]
MALPRSPAHRIASAPPGAFDGEVLVGGDEVERFRTDRSGYSPEGSPEAVVRARTVADVQRAVVHAREHRWTVVPRGAGTGLAGGAAAGAGSLVVDVSGLDRILEISADEAIAVVEPGVITARLDAAAEERGLRYAPDPASAAISTIGGNIATNAGGLRCVKYGVTGDAVLGLDVVLADGSLLHTGRRTVKGVAGLDLTSLFTGAEGTLGVIVGATLRLQPIPRKTITVAGWFDDVEQAATAVSAALAARVRPSLLELLDEPSVRRAEEHLGVGGARPGAFVVAQTDGFGAAEEAEVLADAFRLVTSRVRVGSDPHVAEELLAVRRAALPALETLGRPFIEDIALPRTRIAEATRRIATIAEHHDIPIFVFGHAGDGNLHPIIVAPSETREVLVRAEAAADEIFALALEFGGSITGEHGIGVLKRRWLARELGEDALRVQRSIRQALDPQGLFNRGKVW